MANASEVSCAEMLKILADDTRLEVVRLLMDGPKHVNELNAGLRIESSLFSHHLKVLREGGIVTTRRDGKAVLYSLAANVQGRRTGNAIDLGCCLISFE
jgi:DNA-binding transcriptional ArsR family regulator